MPTRPRSFNSVHYTYLDDLTSGNLSRAAKSVEMYLMLSPFSNMAGIWRLSPETISDDLSMKLPEVKEAMSELEFNERAVFLQSGWLFLKSKWRFDPNFDHPSEKHFRGLMNILKLVPKKCRIAFVTAFPELSYLLSGSLPIPYPMTETDTDTEKTDALHGPWIPNPPKLPFEATEPPVPDHHYTDN